jgi:CheY-like chemotaxis protein
MTRVMVVDDHPMWRDAVARDLTEAGYEVTATAADGAQALRLTRAARQTWWCSTCSCRTCPASR